MDKKAIGHFNDSISHFSIGRQRPFGADTSSEFFPQRTGRKRASPELITSRFVTTTPKRARNGLTTSFNHHLLTIWNLENEPSNRVQRNIQCSTLNNSFSNPTNEFHETPSSEAQFSIPDMAKDAYESLEKLKSRYAQVDHEKIVSPNFYSELLSELMPIAKFISSLQENAIDSQLLEYFLREYLILANKLPDSQLNNELIYRYIAIDMLPLDMVFIQRILLNPAFPCSGSVLVCMVNYLKNPELQTRVLKLLNGKQYSHDALLILKDLAPNLSTEEQQLEYIDRVKAAITHHRGRAECLKQLLCLNNLSAKVLYHAFMLCYHCPAVDNCPQTVLELFTNQQQENLLQYANEISDTSELYIFYSHVAHFVRNTQGAPSITLLNIYMSILTQPILVANSQAAYNIACNIFSGEDFLSIFDEAIEHLGLNDRFNVVYSLTVFQNRFPIDEHEELFVKICRVLSSCLKEYQNQPIDEITANTVSRKAKYFIMHFCTSFPSKDYLKVVKAFFKFKRDIDPSLKELIVSFDEALAFNRDGYMVMLDVFKSIFLPFPDKTTPEYLEKVLKFAESQLLSIEAQYALLYHWAQYAEDCTPELYRQFMLQVAKNEYLVNKWTRLIITLAPHLNDRASLMRALSFMPSAKNLSRKMQLLTAITSRVSDASLLQHIYKLSLPLMRISDSNFDYARFQEIRVLGSALTGKIRELQQSDTNNSNFSNYEDMMRTVNSLIPFPLKTGI